MAGIEAAANQAAEGGKAREDGRRASFAAVALHAGEEQESDQGDDNVGGPDADGGGNNALSSEAGAGDEDEVIHSDDDDGEERAGSAAAAAWLSAERNGDQSKNETGEREGKALVELDTSITPVGAVIVPELAESALWIAADALVRWEHGGKFHGPIGAAEGGDGITIGSGAGEFVSGAVVEMEL